MSYNFLDNNTYIPQTGFSTQLLYCKHLLNVEHYKSVTSEQAEDAKKYYHVPVTSYCISKSH